MSAATKISMIVQGPEFGGTATELHESHSPPQRLRMELNIFLPQPYACSNDIEVLPVQSTEWPWSGILHHDWDP